MQFKVNGKPIRSSNAQSLVGYLESLPFGDLVTTRELSLKTGISHEDGSLRRPELLKRTVKHNNVRVWGSYRTITELNKQLATKDSNA